MPLLQKELNGNMVCDALRSNIRTSILQALIKTYPERLSIGEIKKRLGLHLSEMTFHFHLRKLEECGLVELDESGRGFRALKQALTVTFDQNGIHVTESREVSFAS